MALKCSACLTLLGPHCPGFTCGWVSCPKHGPLRLSDARPAPPKEATDDATDR